MFEAECFLSNVSEGWQTFSFNRWWNPAYAGLRDLATDHHINPSNEKSIIEDQYDISKVELNV